MFLRLSRQEGVSAGKEEKKEGPGRKPLNEIVFYERWGKT